MQWRGPYEIEDVVWNNDYKVDKKVKIYHVNILKKYIQREPSDGPNINQDEEDVAAGGDCTLIDLTCSSIIEAGEQMSEEMINDDELLDLGTCVAKESTKDVKHQYKEANTSSARPRDEDNYCSKSERVITQLYLYLPDPSFWK